MVEVPLELDEIRNTITVDTENRFQFLVLLRDCLANLFQSKEEIQLCYIHGSFLSSQKYSDIDLGILIHSDYNSEVYYERNLEIEIEHAINTKIGLDVPFDIRTLNGQRVMFVYPIIRDGILIYCKDASILVDFEVSTRRSYLDFKPVHKFYINNLHSRYLDET